MGLIAVKPRRIALLTSDNKVAGFAYYQYLEFIDFYNHSPNN